MIVNVRLDVTEEQRNALSLRLFPKATKRLATRQEVNEYMTDHLERINEPDTQSRFEEPENVKSLAGACACACEEDMLSPVPFEPITDDMIDDVVKPDPPYIKSIDKVCAEYKKITGLRRLLTSINNAMFSLANARRQAEDLAPDHLDRLVELSDGAEAVRDLVVMDHDNEVFMELDA